MKRLLLLDDELNVLNALRRLLRQHLPSNELCIEATVDPFAALSRMHEVPFALVISDFRMPAMNGLEFLRQARDIQPHAVRIVLSASSDFGTIIRAVNEIEVFRYLAKPWADDLVDHVRRALERNVQLHSERELADAMRLQRGQLGAAELALRQLEELEPGITRVDWGPNGEVLMPDLGFQEVPGAWVKASK